VVLLVTTNSPCSAVQKVCSNVLDVGKFYTYSASDGTRNLCHMPVGGGGGHFQHLL